MTIKTTLPTDSATRKRYPMLRGALRYAPAAWAGMARISINGNDKHNPGEELHHARGKSMDHGDCIIRHLTDAEDIQAAFERAGPLQTQESLDQLREEVDQLMWRTALYVQQIHEKYLGAPLAPGARLPVPEPKPGTVREICGRVIRLNHLSPDVICTLARGHAGVCGCRSPGARFPVPEPKPETVMEICGDLSPAGLYTYHKEPGHPGRHECGVVQHWV